MPSHRKPSATFLGVGVPFLWVGAALLALLLAFVSWQANVSGGANDGKAEGADDPSAAEGCEASDAEQLSVWVPVEAEPVVSSLAADITGCTEYDVRSVASAQAWSELDAQPDSAPDIWITDSPVWEQTATQTGLNVHASPVLATSPVVLAAPKAFGDGFMSTRNIAADASWNDLLALPRVPVTVADPTSDPAALAMLSTVNGFVTDPHTRNAVLVQLAQGEIEGDALEGAQDGGSTFVPVSEQTLAEDDGRTEYSVISPKEGSGDLRYTMLTLGDSQPRADALETALSSQDNTKAWGRAGFRPAGTGANVAVIDQVPADVPTPAEVDPAELKALINTWAAYVPNIQMTVLVDVSGSMKDQVSDGRNRVDVTREAAAGALATLAPRSKLGLRWFATDRGPDGEDWVEAVPMRPLNDEVGDTTQASLLASAVKELDMGLVGGNTGLYDSLADGYRDMVAESDPDFRSSLVMLTDGKNRDPEGGLNQNDLIDELNDMRDEDRPVEVILLGMGPDVDSKSMQRIAEATGGRYVQVDKGEDMPAVLVELIAARADG